MAWEIDRQRRIGKPYYWYIFLPSCGYADGRTWTRKGAEKALIQARGWLLEAQS